MVPQGATGAQRHRGSWMKREASSEDLIYVTSSLYYPTSSVQVFSYPGGSLVGTLTGFKDVQNVCSDTNGNVWILDLVKESQVEALAYEYAHGATSPKVTLEDTDYPADCSVETATENLAVLNFGSIAVYPNGSGSPTYYNTQGFGGDAFFITYDGSGNLYYAPRKHKPGWLPKGGSAAFFHIHPKAPHGGFGWDGNYFTVRIGEGIAQYTPQGDHSGKAVGTVPVSASGPYYSIAGSLIAITNDSSQVLVYDYPQGGSPTLTIGGLTRAYGVAISVAP